MNKLQVLGMCSVAALTLGAAPTVGEVEVSQDSSRQVKIVYTLSNENAVVTFDVRTNGVSIGRAALARAWGDVNKMVSASEGKQDRTIWWQPRETWPGQVIKDNSLTVAVTAWAKDAPPDYLVLDLVAGAAPTYYQDADEIPGGVSNVVYKTEKVVLRRIHAEGRMERQGSPVDESGRDTSGTENPRFVILTNDYYIGIYPVTRGQFGKAMDRSDVTGANPLWGQSYNQVRGAAPTIDWPVTGHAVSSDSQVQAFRTKTGVLNLDLPTEAQWEFACRAGTSSARYVNDSQLDTIAWYSKSAVQEVGLLKANQFGLYDMLGNVNEWCLDWMETYTYESGKTYIDPLGPRTGDGQEHIGRAMRGGGFNYSSPSQRAAYRNRNRAESSDGTGYRLSAIIPLEANR